jgi:transcription antitermination protein NusB
MSITRKTLVLKGPHKPHNQYSERGRSRRRALQAIYQWQMTGQKAQMIITQFFEEQDMSIADKDYFRDLMTGVERECASIDEVLSPHLDRPLELVDPIERAVLRLASYELKCRPDVPYKVVLNEAIDIAKDFGAEGGHTYVNGVLDKVLTHWRGVELAANTPAQS